VLAYLRSALGLAIWPDATGAASSLPWPAVLILGALSAPVLWLTASLRTLRTRAGILAIAAGAISLIACVIAGSRGICRSPEAVMAATAAASFAALSVWPRTTRNAELAVAATALATVLSWLFVAIAAVA
jgi:hypothetical protein